MTAAEQDHPDRRRPAQIRWAPSELNTRARAAKNAAGQDPGEDLRLPPIRDRRRGSAVRSYRDSARKHGLMSASDAIQRAFTGNLWMPPVALDA